MEKRSGTVNVLGSVAYVSQVAWVMNASLKANIHFINQRPEHLYHQVIKSCALEADIDMLPAGDSTEIGERGINLSGGQKQRVSLARAVLSDADIYLLDDPLSAVDVHVGKHLFEQVIGTTGVLKEKTRVLVTHGVNWLPLCDRVLYIAPETETVGSRFELGTFRELLAANGPLARFMHAISSEPIEGESLEPNNLNSTSINARTSGSSRVSREVSIEPSSPRNRLASQSSVVSKTSAAPLNAEDERKLIQAELKRKEKEKLIQEEKVQQGAVNPSMYLWYIKNQGYILAGLWFGLFVILEGLQIYGSFWLTFWTEDPHLRASVSSQNKSNRTISNSSVNISQQASSIFSIQLFYMGIAWLILLIRAIFYIAHSIAFVFAQMKSARSIHFTLLGIH
jgi:ATP-binding cassette subfamily C (CFTR/MRP) protein 1